MKKVLLALLPALVLAAACSKGKYIHIDGYAQGGVYEVVLNTEGVKESREDLAAAIDSLLQDIDFSLSGYNGNSLLSRFNRGEEITPDRHFREIMELSERYCAESGGAFDVWSGPVFDIWGFGFKKDSLPSDEAIRVAMEQAQEHKRLNFNAIAQGYSCDVIAGYLREAGVRDMLVNIGEIYCEGLNPQGRPWTIGVDNPVDGNNSPGADVKALMHSGGRPCGIVTSGNYRKFYVHDGKKYAHTIDPRTGRPVEHDLLSATIVAPTAAQADAIATACMVLGPEEAQKYILAHEELEGYLICSESSWCSPGFPMSNEGK